MCLWVVYIIHIYIVYGILKHITTYIVENPYWVLSFQILVKRFLKNHNQTNVHIYIYINIIGTTITF